MLYDALYARQSIEKQDSISVESQLAYCQYETHGAPFLTYTDRGFSGKDTHRPGFTQMMNDVQAGKIRRVIVYKLDRISRSILDFANMMEQFQTFHVEFVSSTEKFDTSTAIGRAMLHICIVFAQLERETIQKRVSDAYYARCRLGLYMGGRIPYGFQLADTVLQGIHTSCYVPVPEEAQQILLVYRLYADPDRSLADVVRYLENHHIAKHRGHPWNTARLSELLRNPIYVKADSSVLHFFQNQGTVICNPPEDFIGTNGCYFYRDKQEARSSASALAPGQKNARKGFLVLAPHEGIVPADLWLACQNPRCPRQPLTSCVFPDIPSCPVRGSASDAPG